MQHRSDRGAVWTNRAVGFVARFAVAAHDSKGGCCALGRARASHVDFITVKFVGARPRADERRSVDLRVDAGSTLGWPEAGRQGQQAEAIGCTQPGFHALGVFDPFTEHLASAADAERQATSLRSLPHRAVKAEATQPGEVTHGVFGARDDYQVGASNSLLALNVAHHDARFVFERREIVIVRNARQTDDRNLQVVWVLRRCRSSVLQPYRVFLGYAQTFDEWNDPEDRQPVTRFQVIEPGLQERRIAAKFVDHQPGNSRALFRRQQFQRTSQMREHPATLDVADEQHWGIGGFRHVHIHEVLRAQVYFRGAARALDHNHIE